MSPPTPRSHSKSPNPRFGVVETTTKSPEVQGLEGISISGEKYAQSDLFEGRITSYLHSFGVLTTSQSEKLGLKPFEFPLPTHQKKKNTPET